MTDTLLEIASAPILTDFHRCSGCGCFVQLCACAVEPTEAGRAEAARRRKAEDEAQQR